MTIFPTAMNKTKTIIEYQQVSKLTPTEALVQLYSLNLFISLFLVIALSGLLSFRCHESCCLKRLFED